MRVTAFLVRWDEGWTDRDSGEDLRIEATLSVDHIPSLDEVIVQVDAELDLFAVGQESVTVGIDPAGAGDVPFVDFTIGDEVDVTGVGASIRVMSLTFGEDPEIPGRIVYVPQLGDVIDTPARRTARSLKKMSNGTVGGASKIASPLANISTAIPANCCAPVPEEPPGG